MTYAKPNLQAALSASLKYSEWGSSAIGEDGKTIERAFKELFPVKRSTSVFWVSQRDLEGINEKLSTIESELNKIGSMNNLLLDCLQKRQTQVVHLNLLPNKGVLNPPLDAVVEPDGDGFIARTVDIPLYGVGDDPLDAVEALKAEIENLYDDLTADDSFTSEWLLIKALLSERLTR